MLKVYPSVFVVYRRKILTGSPDPMHANSMNKPCTSKPRTDNTACNELQLVIDNLQDLRKHLDRFKDYLMDFG